MSRSVRCSAALLFTVALAAAACGKKPPVTPNAPPPPVESKSTAPTPPPPPPPPPASPAPKVPTDDEIYSGMSPDEIAKKFLTDVFFDYDSVDLSEATRSALQKNAEFMKRRTTARILVEGHADSRGTNEYNLALGERRADAVRDYIVSLGIPTERITITSKGEEQPFCREETEACWQQNRRGHFIVTQR